ncbi:MAG: hypothetical protein JXP34_01385 [Planctomycetes bacterium]|nr:hypothetical protein [Planctomycetota bacterium]
MIRAHPEDSTPISRRAFIARSRAVGLGVAGAALLRGFGGSQGRAAPATAPGRPPGPNETFLRDQARRVIDSARLAAGQKSGRHHNATAHDLHVPGGNMGYPAYWVRDSVMMLGGDFIPVVEIEGWIRLICSTLRGPEDWQVRPGVIVPAYAVPDHINFDGKATFYPGNYETGERQGGHPWGKYPPLDDNFFFLTAVCEHWKLAEDLALFRSTVRTFSGEARLSDLCEKVYRMPPCDEATGLLTTGDIEKENAKDWGFCDTVFKSGKLLFPSLLKRTAAIQLAEMFAAAGEVEKAAFYRNDARRIADALEPAFLHATRDGSEAWLHSATGVGDQPDVWGSALAVHSGALRAATAAKVSRALVRAFRERTAVRGGFVRHIPTTDPLNGGGWEKALSKPGEYQNGGYWGAPAGWYIAAVSETDPNAAADLAAEYIGALRADKREDGTTRAWEWYNPDTGARANPLYVATVALPYLSLEKADLLKVLDAR